MQSTHSTLSENIRPRPAQLADASHAASELHDCIEIWVNEGGAGGEDDEIPVRPRGGG
jgi:hypothetical protein